MTMPGFNAEVATPGWPEFRGTYAPLAGRPPAPGVTMAAQCCPPGMEAGECNCKAPLVYCDCTIPHCTGEAQCRRECKL